jgi:hypothetical protein
MNFGNLGNLCDSPRCLNQLVAVPKLVPVLLLAHMEPLKVGRKQSIQVRNIRHDGYPYVPLAAGVPAIHLPLVNRTQVLGGHAEAMPLC